MTSTPPCYTPPLCFVKVALPAHNPSHASTQSMETQYAGGSIAQCYLRFPHPAEIVHRLCVCRVGVQASCVHSGRVLQQIHVSPCLPLQHETHVVQGAGHNVHVASRGSVAMRLVQVLQRQIQPAEATTVSYISDGGSYGSYENGTLHIMSPYRSVRLNKLPRLRWASAR